MRSLAERILRLMEASLGLALSASSSSDTMAAPISSSKALVGHSRLARPQTSGAWAAFSSLASRVCLVYRLARIKVATFSSSLGESVEPTFARPICAVQSSKGLTGCTPAKLSSTTASSVSAWAFSICLGSSIGRRASQRARPASVAANSASCARILLNSNTRKDRSCMVRSPQF